LLVKAVDGEFLVIRKLLNEGFDFFSGEFEVLALRIHEK
jgi:hypothetical protein